MLSGILHSPCAIQMNIAIMRAFVRMRTLLGNHRELTQKLDELDEKLMIHDDQIAGIIESIRRLMQPPKRPKQKIGYL